MKKNKRFVFDTNVIISALLFTASTPGLAVKKGFGEGDVLFSTETLEELITVFNRKKFNRYLPMFVRQLLLTKFEKASTLVEVKESVTLCRDPKDDKFLSLAKESKASAVISGDEDLLILNPFNDIPILTPDEFLKKF